MLVLQANTFGSQEDNRVITFSSACTVDEVLLVLRISLGASATGGGALFLMDENGVSPTRQLAPPSVTLRSLKIASNSVIHLKSGGNVTSVPIVMSVQLSLDSELPLSGLLLQIGDEFGFSESELGSLKLMGAPKAPKKTSVAFGRVRGQCSDSACDCTCYKGDSDGSGGACRYCGHFPAQHIDAGDLEALVELDMDRTMGAQESASSVLFLKTSKKPLGGQQRTGLVRSSSVASSSTNSFLPSNVEFGAPLSMSVKGPNGVPRIVLQLCEYLLDEDRVATEGIFRMPGNQSKVDELISAYSAGDEPDIFTMLPDTLVIADLLKGWLRTLPEGIFTDALYPRFMSCARIAEMDIRRAYMRSLLNTLPQDNFRLAEYLVGFFVMMRKHAMSNKMTDANLAMVFGPIFLKDAEDESMLSPSPRDPAKSKRKSMKVAKHMSMRGRSGSLSKITRSRKGSVDGAGRLTPPGAGGVSAQIMEKAKEYELIQQLLVWLVTERQQLFDELELVQTVTPMIATENNDIEGLGQLKVVKGETVYVFSVESGDFTGESSVTGKVGLISPLMLKPVKK